MEGRIDSRRLRTGFLAQSEFPKLIKASDNLSRAPIYIDDTPNIGPLEIRSKSRRHAARYGLDLIVVDYLQLMSLGRVGESRQVEISEISRRIKGLARELQVPVMALSQLNREAEKDESGLPKLSHLRESGAIEQDADVVILIHRAEYYLSPEERQKLRQEDDPNHILGEADLIIAKQRNGPTGDVKLHWHEQFARFENASHRPFDEFDLPGTAEV